jgi:non-specific serine/threonine protein kinase
MNKVVELPNSLPIGTRLAEFEIRQVIGEGGFGIVYLAFDHSLQRTVAIKEYMPAALASRASDHTVSVRSRRHAEAFGAGLRSFINEARLLAQFDHPALVKVYRFWELHGTAYMAMRYYEGRTFKSVVGDHPELVSEAWLKDLLKPVLGALEALYAANILHRDVSPENIMIQPDGRPVLLDFGAARQIVQDMAQSLTVILKPGFAPVEQYADDE